MINELRIIAQQIKDAIQLGDVPTARARAEAFVLRCEEGDGGPSGG